MNANENLTLPRLLNRRQALALIQSIEESVSDIALALVRADGSLFVSTANWAQSGTDLARLVKSLDASQTIEIDQHRLYPLSAGPHLVGAMVVYDHQPARSHALERALHHSLNIFLTESLEKRDVATEALDRYREINLMYRVSETIGVSLDPEAIPRMVLEESNHVIRADAGLVLLSAQAGDSTWEVKSSFGADHAAALHAVALAETIKPALGDRPQILTDLPASAPAYAAILWTPLKAQERVFGGILLGRLEGREEFTASDEKLLTALARQAAVAIENSQLHQASLERERLKRELQLAHDVQASLIPRETPQIAGWDFAAYWQPAREVGGDFYDFIQRDGGHLGFALGDVSDKGMHAALFMALTRSTLRASTLAAPTPREGVNRANRLVVADSTGGMFVTLFYGQLDPAANKLTYVNAGHNPPLLYRAASKQLTELTRTGIMVGFDDAYKYKQRTVQLRRGDFILFYTDGVTESVDAQDEQYGEERMHRVLVDHATDTPNEILEALKQSLAEFTGDIPPFDDVTIVIAKRLAQ